MAQNHFLRALLKNPKTGRLIREAWDSPLGSTKRAQVNSIFKAFKNTVSSDGRGGNVLTGLAYPEGITPPTGSNFTYPGSDIQSQPLLLQPYLNLNNLSITTPQSTTTSLKPAPVTIPSVPASSGAGLTAQTIAQLASFMGKTSLSDYAKPGTTWSPLGGYTPPAEPYKSPSLKYTQNYQTGIPTYSSEVSTGVQPTTKTTATTIEEKRKSLSPEAFQTWATGAFSTLAAQRPTGISGVTPSKEAKAPVTPSPTPETPQGQPITWQNILPYIEQKLGEGIPAAAIPRTIMSDPETMASLYPGTEGTIKGTLSESLAGIEEKLRTQLGLDDLERKQMSLISQGAYLPKDMEDYIYSRDEYVKQMDSMITDTKNKMATGVYSNDPTTQQGVKEYLNMLYYLKGTQNKRYQDMINDSVNQYNTQTTNVGNQITYLNSKYTDVLQKESAIVEEEYNQMMNEIIAATQQAQALSSGGWGSTLYGAAVGTISGTLDSSKIPKLPDVINQMDPLFTADGKIGTFTTAGLAAKIGEAKNILQIPPQMIFTYLQSKITALGQSGSITQLEEFKNAMVDLNTTVKDTNGNTFKKGDLLLGNLGATDALNSNISSVLVSPTKSLLKGKETILRDAIMDLVNDIGSTLDPTAVQEWKDNYKDKLDMSIINGILGAFKTEVGRGNPQNPFWLATQTPTTRWYRFDKEKVDDATLIDNVAKAISGRWISEMTVNASL